MALVPYSETGQEEELVKELANKLVPALWKRPHPFHQASYDLATTSF